PPPRGGAPQRVVLLLPNGVLQLPVADVRSPGGGRPVQPSRVPRLRPITALPFPPVVGLRLTPNDDAPTQRQLALTFPARRANALPPRAAAPRPPGARVRPQLAGAPL